jgi:hypothetical protein
MPCREVGGELVAEWKDVSKAVRDRPLNAPAAAASPPIPLAVVMIDRGRM